MVVIVLISTFSGQEWVRFLSFGSRDQYPWLYIESVFLLFFLIITDQPNTVMPDSTVPKHVQAKWLLEICENCLKKFVFNAGEIESLVTQSTELQQAQREAGRWKCRHEGCQATYVLHSSRVRCVIYLFLRHQEALKYPGHVACTRSIVS